MKTKFTYNTKGLKNSTDRYRNIKGICYKHYSSNPSCFTDEIVKADQLNLKHMIINNELFIEFKE